MRQCVTLAPAPSVSVASTPSEMAEVDAAERANGVVMPRQFGGWPACWRPLSECSGSLIQASVVPKAGGLVPSGVPANAMGNGCAWGSRCLQHFRRSGGVRGQASCTRQDTAGDVDVQTVRRKGRGGHRV